MDRHQRFEHEALPHLRSLYATAYRLTRHPQDAEDLVQETYLRAFRGFDRFAPGTHIKAWLYTILVRARADLLRRRGRTIPTVELEEEGPGVPAVAPEQERRLATGGEEVNRALADLPEQFRTAVVLRDVEDFSYDEIARMLGIPIGTVMSRIHRGRALLRAALAGGAR